MLCPQVDQAASDLVLVENWRSPSFQPLVFNAWILQQE
jgi:hypothetical protein